MQKQGLDRMEAMKLCYTFPARTGGAPFVHHAVRTMVRLGLAASDAEQVAGLFAGAVACGTLELDELSQKGLAEDSLAILSLLVPRAGENLSALASRLLQQEQFVAGRLLLAHALEHCGDPSCSASGAWCAVLGLLQARLPHTERQGLVEGQLGWAPLAPQAENLAAPKAAA